MMRPVRNVSLLLLLMSLSSPVLGQNYYMYAPRAAAPGEKNSHGDGVLVREVEVKKGDTLSHISRRFSGRGSYYPQILLFNDIRNPHRIRDKELIRVPVSSQEPAAEQRVAKASTMPPVPERQGASKAATTQPVSELALSDLKTVGAKKVKKAARGNHGRKRGTARHASSQAASGQRQFKRAMASYRNKQWRDALDQFDRFLAENPSSRHAAEANLYKAECYLKLADQ